MHAVDTSMAAKAHGQKPNHIFSPYDPSKTGGILSTIRIGEEMLRRNIITNRNLNLNLNCTMGIVRKIEWPALCRNQLEVKALLMSILRI